ncbi:MAG: segregation and condensation protein A [bacterium]
MHEITYQIKLDNFEGPLDLLLHLIKKEKVDLYNISIATITDQYLAYIKQLEGLNVEIAGEFIVMAAYLINLKSRRLLKPADRESEDDDDDIDRMKKELIEKLAEYQLFKKGGEVLLVKQKEQEKIFSSHHIIQDKQDEDILNSVDILALAKAFYTIMSKKKEGTLVHSIKIDPIDMKYEMSQLLALLNNEESYSFYLYCSVQENYSRIVVIFIALLELIRLQQIVVRQSELFGDIQMHLLK